MKENVLWVDWAKFIGIYLVIFGHAMQVTCIETAWAYHVWNIIYQFHMPLFFMLSGFLYKKGLGEKNKILTGLVYPYMIYQFIFVIKRSIGEICKGEVFESFFYKLLNGLVCGDGYDTNFFMSLCVPCWFIVCIIQLRVLFSFILLSKKNIIFLVVFSILFLYIREWLDFDWYFCLDSTIMSVPYFLFGYYLKRVSFCLEHRKNVIQIVILFAILCGAYAVNGVVQMNGPSIGKDPLLCYVGGFSGGTMIIVCAMFLKTHYLFVSEISHNTLFIIFFHWLFLSFWGLTGVYRLWNGISSPSLAIMGTLLLSFLILCVNWCAIRYLRPKFPLLFGKNVAARY